MQQVQALGHTKADILMTQGQHGGFQMLKELSCFKLFHNLSGEWRIRCWFCESRISSHLDMVLASRDGFLSRGKTQPSSKAISTLVTPQGRCWQCLPAKACNWPSPVRRDKCSNHRSWLKVLLTDPEPPAVVLMTIQAEMSYGTIYPSGYWLPCHRSLVSTGSISPTK